MIEQQTVRRENEKIKKRITENVLVLSRIQSDTDVIKQQLRVRRAIMFNCI